jgi:hypothetical protein
MVPEKRVGKQWDEKAREVKVSDEMYLEGVLEERQNGARYLEEALEERQNVGIVRYVMCGGIRWMDSETVCDESESLNSWTFWRRMILDSPLDAYRHEIDSWIGSYSSGCRPKCQQWNGLQLAIVTSEGYSTPIEFWKVLKKALWTRIVKEGKRRSRPESPCHPLAPCFHSHRTQ